MSFLNQLKSQASEIQNQQRSQAETSGANTAQTEAASMRAWSYVSDLVKQLNVLQPAATGFTLDGKTQWPAMKLTGFRADTRRKKLRDQDVFDVISLGWEIVPQTGAPIGGAVSVNFPPDLQRVESRLADGHVKHERSEIRDPDKNKLLSVRFDYTTESRGSVRITSNHDTGMLAFRVANASGFGILHSTLPAAQVQTGTMDELAKMIVGQPHRFG